MFVRVRACSCVFVRFEYSHFPFLIFFLGFREAHGYDEDEEEADDDDEEEADDDDEEEDEFGCRSEIRDQQ